MAPSSSLPLEDKIAVVAGASRAIGKGIALELAAAGATVYLPGRVASRPAPGDAPALTVGATAAEIESAGGRAVALRCDFTDEAQITAAFERVRSDHGRLDVLVNSVFSSPSFGASIGKPFWELPLGFWREVVDLGTGSAYMASVAAAPLLLAAGGGLIVNVSARGAERYRYNVAYGVGKAALDRMTRDMAHDLRDHGVAVVSIWPNVTRTEHLDRAAREGNSPPVAGIDDLGSLETPRYSGRAVVALATDPSVMDRSGKRYWVAELGADYGFSDELGREHPLPE